VRVEADLVAHVANYLSVHGCPSLIGLERGICSLVPADNERVDDASVLVEHAGLVMTIGTLLEHGNLILKLLDQSLVAFARLQQSRHAFVSFVSVELDLTPRASNFHPWTLTAPVLHNQVLAVELFSSAELAVGLESRQIADPEHMFIELVVRKLRLA